MERSVFIKTISKGALAMSGLSAFKVFADGLKKQDVKMPVLFMGHGSPMNGIEDNIFSAEWRSMGKEMPKPEAVLVISAHWLTKGTKITAMKHPRTIHDFGGFPRALYDVQYPAPGQPELAGEVRKMVHSADVGLDHDWGLDHGAWTVVRHMYPDADIPVLQLSIDYNQPASYHYDLATELASLREKGVLILGSGNMVHNLRMISWEHIQTDNYGFDWAVEMHELFKQKIADRDHKALINYQSISPSARLAVPTPDHYFPLIYTIALQGKEEEAVFFNDKLVGGSLNMTSVKFG